MRKVLSVLLTLVMTVSLTYSTVCATTNRMKGEDTAKTNEQAAEVNESDGNKASSDNKKEKKSEDTETKSSKEEPTEDAEKKQEEKDAPVDTKPTIKAEAYLVFNPSTGVVILEQNTDARVYPASTTKIMTAYLALMHLDLSKECVVSKSAVDIEKDGSNMGLLSGEKLTVKQLLEALMIQSANDAANVLAEEVSGSLSEFVKLMNSTAEELGMKDTHFENPHGYHHDNHYTTARDMAKLAAVAMENEVFAEMAAMKRLVIPPTNKYNQERKFATRNAMINQYSDLSIQYRFATGIKTGHTNSAGYCFVGSATKNDMDLISVVFKSTSYEQAFIDTKKLFEYSYSNFRSRTVIKANDLASTCNVKWARGKDHLILKTNKDVQTILPRNNFSEELLRSEIIINENITAPVKEGQELGCVKFFYEEKLVAESKLYASRDVSRSILKQCFSFLLNKFFLIFLGLIAVLIIILRIRVVNQKKLRRKRKKARGM